MSSEEIIKILDEVCSRIGAAMGVEEKVCKQVEEEYRDCRPYEDSLIKICHEITRKVKSVLWTS